MSRTLRRLAVGLAVVAVATAVGAHASAQSTEGTAPTTPTAPTAGTAAGSGQDVCDPLAGQNLRVATKPVEPFIFLDGGDQPRGFSAELWQLVSARLGTATTWVERETVEEALATVEDGDADLAIAAFSVTPDRQKRFDYSTTYLSSGLQLMVRTPDEATFGDSLRSLFDSWLLRVAIAFLVLLFIAGTAVWLLERRHNEDFPHGIGGIGEGMWWAVVTMATVGYGDRVTESRWGRVFSAVWILVGLVLVAQFTATITARLTVEELNEAATSIDELVGKSLVTVEGTAAADLLAERNIEVRKVGSIDEMRDSVLEGRDDVAVYDGPILRHLAVDDARLKVVGGTLTADFYAVVFPEDSPLEECVDRAIGDVIHDGTLQRLSESWFGQ